VALELADDSKTALIWLLHCDDRLNLNRQSAAQARNKLSRWLKTADNGKRLVAQIARNSLSHSIANSDSITLFSKPLQRQIIESSLTASKQALLVVAETRKIAALLAESQVSALFYKGISLAQRTTGSLDGRGSGDIDILVRATDTIATHRALSKLDFFSSFRIQPSDNKIWRFFLWLHKELPYASKRVQIDLHWRLTQGDRITPSFEQLWSRANSMKISDTTFMTLSDEDSLALMCYSFVVDGCQNIKQLVDIRRLQLNLGQNMSQGFSKQIEDFQNAVLHFTSFVFEDTETCEPLPGRQGKFLTLIQKNWQRNLEPVESNSPIVPASVHFEALRLQACSGSPLINLTRYLVGRIFEFRNQDFSHPRWLLLRAFEAELRFQVIHRYRGWRSE
jgi:hypothetical protein